jgi:hypothetical protein
VLRVPRPLPQLRGCGVNRPTLFLLGCVVGACGILALPRPVKNPAPPPPPPRVVVLPGGSTMTLAEGWRVRDTIRLDSPYTNRVVVVVESLMADTAREKARP